MSAIKVAIIETQDWSPMYYKKFDVTVKVTPEFMMEPKELISDEEKIEFIAEEIKQQFIKQLSKKK